MKPFLLVFIGGGLGSALRYLISIRLNVLSPHFYWGTFVVNVIGCFLLGYLTTWSLKQEYLNQPQILLLTTGFCGGFTTFSTFSSEGIQMLNQGAYTSFLLYTLGSIITGFLFFWLGIKGS